MNLGVFALYVVKGFLNLKGRYIVLKNAENLTNIILQSRK